jgi:hypothetical protein
MSSKYSANEEPREDAEVEAHTNKYSANEEPREDAETDDEVEGHVHKSS